MNKKYFSLVLALVAGLFVATQSVSADAALFKKKKCDKCHSVKGPDAKLDKKGSNLSKIGAEQNAAWLDEFLKDADKKRKADPELAKRSKKFKKAMKTAKLSDDERAALVKYLGSLK